MGISFAGASDGDDDANRALLAAFGLAALLLPCQREG
ncbi:hypothetical protein J2S28_005770 [Rhizobium sp. SLBN-94]|nr:hypothetical protein [Rhizobium sp. SLBN-94]